MADAEAVVQTETKDLQEIFNSFDADKSGTIELQQIKSVASALGSEISESELKSIVKKLDSNGDGKISFQEFKFWWENGHKGNMGKLVYLKAKSMRLTKQFTEKLSNNGVSLEQLSQSTKMNEIKAEVSFQGEQHEGINITAEVYHKGQGIEKVKSLGAKYGQLDRQSINLLIVVSAKDVNAAKEDITTFFKALFDSQFMPLKVEDLQNNDYFRLKVRVIDEELVISVEILQGLLALFEGPLNKAKGVEQKLGLELYTSILVDLATNFSIDDLLQKNLIEALCQGFKLKAQCSIPEALLLKWREIGESAKDQFSNIKLQGVLGMLLKNLSIKLKLNSPEKVNGFFQMLGIKEMLNECPSLSELLQQVALFGEVMQLKNNESDPKHFIYKFLRFLNQHQINNFKINVHHLDYLVSTTISIPNYTKIIKIIFNEL